MKYHIESINVIVPNTLDLQIKGTAVDISPEEFIQLNQTLLTIAQQLQNLQQSAQTPAQ